MAERLFFRPNIQGKCKYIEEKFSFKYFTGFAVSQKQKSIVSLHNAIDKKYPGIKILEVSTKSLDSNGVKMSAFNLKMKDAQQEVEVPLENIFQSSKVFENGGPYRDLLRVHPKDAKKDERLRNSGELLKFNYQNEDWPLFPKTIFYDWIFINALHKLGLEKEILKFDGFTDIEFNHNKSINCQARSVALYSSIIQMNIVDKVLKDKVEFRKLYGETVEKKQISFEI